MRGAPGGTQNLYEARRKNSSRKLFNSLLLGGRPSDCRPMDNETSWGTVLRDFLCRRLAFLADGRTIHCLNWSLPSFSFSSGEPFYLGRLIANQGEEEAPRFETPAMEMTTAGAH